MDFEFYRQRGIKANALLPLCEESDLARAVLKIKGVMQHADREFRVLFIHHEAHLDVKTTQTFAQEQAQFRTFQEQQGEVPG